MVLTLARPNVSALGAARRATRSRLAYGLLVGLALTLPFEPIRSLYATPWLEVNHLKLLVAASVVAWAANLVHHRTTPRAWQTYRSVVLAALAFLLIATLSALFAPTGRVEALKFVGRIASGLALLLLVLELVTTPARLAWLVWAIILGAGLSACIGLGEAAGWRPLDPLLALFKLAPTRVGGDLRVSASFQYATIAAMFFELAIPLALAAAALARTWRARVLAMSIAIACTVTVILTLTRAGIAVLALACALLLGLAWARPRFRALVLPTGVAAVSLVVVFVGLFSHVASFDTRLSTENDLGWYAATYEAPSSIDLTADSATALTIAARNTGQATWTAGGEHPYALGYHWLSADGAFELQMPQMTVGLPRDVASGETVNIPVDIRAGGVPPGDYRLAWGMLQNDIVWFHYRGSPDAETLVHVTAGAAPPAVTPALTVRDDQVVLPMVVPRAELWSAARTIIVQHPLLGIGPDNFRHVYGAYLGLIAWDDRVHANNLYLELLADLGVIGAAAFGVLMAPAFRAFVTAVRAPPPGPLAIWVACLGASLLAFFLHGLLDYFLEFTPVYLLFWLIVGLLVAARTLSTSDAQAAQG